MADIDIGGYSGAYSKRFRDQQDGTHAEVVYAYTLGDFPSLVADGRMYSLYYYEAGLVAAATRSILFEVPSTTTMFLQYISVDTNGLSLLELVELSAGTAGGTTLTPNNHNRLDGPNSLLTVTDVPTGLTDDVILNKTWTFTPKAKDAKATGVIGSVEKSLPWNLAPSTKYLMRFTNNEAADAIDFALDVVWYEGVL